MFADIFGFAQISMELSPQELVSFLNMLYNVMDERISDYDVYKVETINDCYMVASGMNREKPCEEINVFVKRIASTQKGERWLLLTGKYKRCTNADA